MSIHPEILRRAEQYAIDNGLILGNALGAGIHGSVFSVENQSGMGRSAIKVHGDENCYRRERDVYIRLFEENVTRIRDCAVPELLAYDDAKWILEMTVVGRPFVLDFAGAYLDRPFDFSEEVWADWQTEKSEQFGVHWPEVQAVLRVLETYGVFMEDVNPNNISFRD